MLRGAVGDGLVPNDCGGLQHRKMGKGYDNQRFELRGIGSQVALAVKKAKARGPGTLPNRCAWLIAEEAIHKLGAQVDTYFPAWMLITATGARLRRKG